MGCEFRASACQEGNELLAEKQALTASLHGIGLGVGKVERLSL